MQLPSWYINEQTQQEFALVVSARERLSDDCIAWIEQRLERENIDYSCCFQSESMREWLIHATGHNAWLVFRRLLQEESYSCDLAILPQKNRRKHLLLCDMDSTIVVGETLDDLAESLGIGEQVSTITARAMRGEISFIQALDNRMELVAGTDITRLQEIGHKTPLHAGAELLIRRARHYGLKTVLVSGGLEPVVELVADRLGFDSFFCNQLEIVDDRVTGKVYQPIIDGSAKLAILEEQCRELNIEASDACCIGDGANDLLMLQKAGLGIAFQAKPIVQQAIAYRCNHSPLHFALSLMGIPID